MMRLLYLLPHYVALPQDLRELHKAWMLNVIFICTDRHHALSFKAELNPD
jgi:hypothetical protein